MIFRILLRSRFIPRVHGDETMLVKCNYWVARKIELAKRGVYSIRKMDESMNRWIERWLFRFFFLTTVLVIILQTIFVWPTVIFKQITCSHLFCDRLSMRNSKFSSILLFWKIFFHPYGILIKQFHMNFVLLIFGDNLRILLLYKMF